MISVIIPIYNAEDKLEQMLDSILLQTMEDYEVVMVDDGSSDGSALICKKYAEKDSRFKYFYQQNSGVSSARNNGFNYAEGEYIAFVDADDRIDYNYLEELHKACQNADIAVCDVSVEADGAVTRLFTGEDGVLGKNEAISLLLVRRVINSGPYAKLFRRKIAEGIAFPPLRTYEDILYVLSAFDKAQRVAVTSKTQYHYINNACGAMSSVAKSPSKDVVVASEKIMEYIRLNKKKVSAECVYTTVSHVFQYVVAVVNGDWSQSKDFIGEAVRFFRKYIVDILKCKAVPIKEKIVFSGFAFGWVYTNKKWTCIGR